MIVMTYNYLLQLSLIFEKHVSEDDGMFTLWHRSPFQIVQKYLHEA